MNITHFKVNQNEIQRTAPQEARIVAGSAGTNAVQFEFEPAVWAELTATAVFQADDVEKSVLITDKTAAYEIPHEVMASAGACLKVGVFGVDSAGQIIVPTTYAKVCDAVLSGANLDAEEAISETDSIYAQWVAAVAEDAATAAAAAQQASSYVETVEVAAQSLADAVELAEGLEADATAAAQSAIDSIESAAATQIVALQEIGAKAPILSEDETWLIWDTESESYQDTEVSAFGAAFTYADFTEEQLAALKGEKGDTGDTGATGATGAQGAAFTYADFTEEQLAALKGEKGDTGDAGATGATGAQGAAFTYADFTDEQLAALKGEKGDTGDTGATGATGAQGAAFTYADFTEEQLAALKGEKGDTGDAGATGATGAQGAAFTYADFTEEQLAALKGEKGDTGDTGATGATGAQGAAFTYADFTEEQLAALKGEKGDTGDAGATGATGATGAQGEPTTVNGLTGESITLTAADIALTNYTAATEASAIAAGDTISQAIAKLEAGNTSATGSADGIATYIHAYTYDEDTAVGTHSLTGSGANGKFKATVTATIDLLVIDGTSYDIVQGDYATISVVENRWYSFILDNEDCTINFPSANGSALALKVVGAETQPATASQNTIWVQTVGYTDYYQLSTLAPTTRADGSALTQGDLWIKTVISDGFILYLDSENLVSVTVQFCYLWDGTAWEQISYQIYNDNAWVTPVIGQVYYYGNTIPALGSWENRTSSTSTATFTDSADGLYLANTVGVANQSNVTAYHWAVASNLVDLSDVDSIVCHYNGAVRSNAEYSTHTGTVRVGASVTKDDYAFIEVTILTLTGSAQSGTLTVDVSSIEGMYYLKLCEVGYSSYGAMSVAVRFSEIEFVYN